MRLLCMYVILTCSGVVANGRLGGGKAAGAGLGAGGAGPLLFVGGHGTGLILPPRLIGPLLKGTPVVWNESTGFLGTTAADVVVDAVVDPPSDAWWGIYVFFSHSFMVLCYIIMDIIFFSCDVIMFFLDVRNTQIYTHTHTWVVSIIKEEKKEKRMGREEVRKKII